MQKLGGGGKPLVVVDYAHSPDALEKALGVLKDIARAGGGRLIAVFGCGGDRDRGKRPLMGTVASRHADAVVITSDNPRGEDPSAIIDEINAGVTSACEVIEDRREAIAYAIAAAGASDVVLLAGKGHETYQEVAGRRLPFSDALEAERALAGWSR
jgi:UDP-N-acetylmuramoyl-L-alanyl-D-glutamate--2,6-diaminopimelate ligase